MGNRAQCHGVWEEHASVGKGREVVLVGNAGNLSDRRICKYKHVGEDRSLVCSRYYGRYMY